MQINGSYTARRIMGELILVPTGESILEFNGLITMNALGEFIWGLLPEADSVDDIVSRVVEEYEVDERTARADVCEFLDELRARGVLA
ncbi:MAG: PqqD family protein [Clostridia bacterium]|nr:PqqD family protein [Clostridia bacterium]